ncbi:glycosyltransferase [Nonomuraea sp. NN258]|nr:glycosyltransferase [Nonomuraea antri]
MRRLLPAILEQGLDCDILFMDDNSPDGTGKVLDEFADEHPRVHVVHRPGKQGIGSAHQAGIAWAYEHGYAWLITMDSDFAHPPEYLPDFLAAAEQGVDVVVGSRYLRRTGLPGWSLRRRILTRTGHFLTLTMLGMPYDATGAFRFYRLTSVPHEAFKLVGSTGYSFFFESLYILHVNRFSIRQIPIHLPGRTFGTSKMDGGEVATSLRLLLSLFVRKLFTPRRFRISP